MNTAQPPACYVGIDFAVAANHAINWITPDGATHTASIKPLHASLSDWAARLRDSLPDTTSVRVGVEGGARSILGLLAREGFEVYPLNPAAVKAHCKSLRISGAKDDPFDARAIRRFVEQNHAELRPFSPIDPASDELARLASDRRGFVARRTAAGNAFLQALRDNAPGLVAAFGGCCPALANLVLKWPALPLLKARRAKTIEAFLRRDCRLRKASRIAAILEAIKQAPASAAFPSGELLAASQAELYLHLSATIARYDKRITELRKAHPLDGFAMSFPGMGPALAPRLIGFLGEDTSRFETAGELLCACGIAPVKMKSGKTMDVALARWACNKYDRQTFHEFAQSSVLCCGWARKYYDAKRAAGKPAQVVYRALAFKWIRIIHTCWRKGELYDEAKVRSIYQVPLEA